MSEGRVRLLEVGPTLPATHMRRPSSSAARPAACRAMRAPSRASERAWSARPCASREMRFALNVLVSMMSAPASMYARWMEAMSSGRFRLRHSAGPSGASPAERRWIIVPIAPSRIRMRSLGNSVLCMSVDAITEDYLTKIKSISEFPRKNCVAFWEKPS